MKKSRIAFRNAIRLSVIGSVYHLSTSVNSI